MDLTTSSNGGSRRMGLDIRVTESMLQAREKEASKSLEEAEKINNQPHLLNLNSYVKTSFDAAVRSKTSNMIEQRFLDCARRRKGEYDPAKLAEIRKTGGSEIWMNLSSVKSRALESWIRDVELPPGDKPWSLANTIVPELPRAKQWEIVEQVVQELSSLAYAKGSTEAINELDDANVKARMDELGEKTLKESQKVAKKAAKRMETHIEDQLTEGNYYKALSEFITDLSTFPTAFLKGPIVKRCKKLEWREDSSGEFYPEVTLKPVRIYQRVSGYDIYPSPGAKNLNDGSLHERARLRVQDLERMKGVPGFKDSAIDAVLSEHQNGGLRQWLTIDQERADLEDRPNEVEDPNPLIDCIIFWGSIRGEMLLEWGMPKKKVPDPNISYHVTCWLVGRWVIMARLNSHPLDERPYYSASYESVNDSIWGKSPIELYADCQDLCNACARAISNNLGIASGPLVEFYKNRIAPGYDFQTIYPWMIIPTEDDGMGANNPAINFYQPDSIVEPLLKVFEFFFKQASEQSGIPAYIYGNQDVGGAGKTASGLSMLMNAANKTLKGVITHIDENVISKSIKEHWIHVMLYDKDIQKSGDINVVARASQHLIIEEQLQLRRTEMLEATNNDWDRAIIGDKGRAKMLTETFESLHLDPDGIVPDAEELDMMAEYKQLMAQAQAQAAAELGIPPQDIGGGGMPGGGGGMPNPAVIDAAGNQVGKPPGATMTRVNRRAGMNYQ